MLVDADTITQTAHFLSSGSVAAVVALLLSIIGGLLWDRMRILKKLDSIISQFLEAQQDCAEKFTEAHKQSSDKFVITQAEFSDKITALHHDHTLSIKELINTYHEGNLKLVQSMNDLTHMIEVVRR